MIVFFPQTQENITKMKVLFWDDRPQETIMLLVFSFSLNWPILSFNQNRLSCYVRHTLEVSFPVVVVKIEKEEFRKVITKGLGG